MYRYILVAGDNFSIHIDSVLPGNAIAISRAEYDGLLNGTHIFNGSGVVQL